MKKLALLLTIIFCVSAMLFSCSDGGQTQDVTDGAQTEPEVKVELPVATYVGSHAASNAMGDVVSGHLINIFADGSVKIYYGIKAGMQGVHYGVYTGSYADGVVTYSFVRSEKTETETDSFELPDGAQSFKAKVFCLASYPNSAGGGISYVKIDPIIPDESAEYVFIGSKLDGDSAYGLYLELKEGAMKLSASADGKFDTVTGSYEIEYSDLDDIDSYDKLKLEYRPLFAKDGTASSEIKFADTSFISFTPGSEGDIMPKLTLATAINIDGTRD